MQRLCCRPVLTRSPPFLLVSFSSRGQTKVWDLRTYKEVHSYLTKTPPTDMDISQRGLLSLGFGCHVQVRVRNPPTHLCHNHGQLLGPGNGSGMLSFLFGKGRRVPARRVNRPSSKGSPPRPPPSINRAKPLWNRFVKVWKDAIATKAKAPYMEHELPSKMLHRTRFRPLQDVLGLGHTHG